MNSVSTNDILNRLLVIHHRSLPMYLHYAVPWMQEGSKACRETLELIVRDQQRTVDRLGEMILDNDGQVEFGAFPMNFTGLHDLSFDYLRCTLIARQERNIAVIEDCVDQLADPMAKAAAEEALGEAKGHLDSLRELPSTTSQVAS